MAMTLCSLLFTFDKNKHGFVYGVIKFYICFFATFVNRRNGTMAGVGCFTDVDAWTYVEA